MSEPVPIQTPGGYAPAFALGVDDSNGNLALVAASHPLPVRAQGPDIPAPLTGAATGLFLAGPFTPALQTPVQCTLSGSWTGTVQLMRGNGDNGEPEPVTLAGGTWGRYAANANEPVWEESEAGATLWLHCSITSGTLNYRLAQ